MKSLLILGAGGFGQMVKETAIQLGYEEIVFLDDAAFGKDVVGKCCDYTARYGEYKMAVAAFGNNHTSMFFRLPVIINSCQQQISFIILQGIYILFLFNLIDRTFRTFIPLQFYNYCRFICMQLSGDKTNVCKPFS